MIKPVAISDKPIKPASKPGAIAVPTLPSSANKVPRVSATPLVIVVRTGIKPTKPLPRPSNRVVKGPTMLGNCSIPAAKMDPRLEPIEPRISNVAVIASWRTPDSAISRIDVSKSVPKLFRLSARPSKVSEPAPAISRRPIVNPWVNGWILSNKPAVLFSDLLIRSTPRPEETALVNPCPATIVARATFSIAG